MIEGTRAQGETATVRGVIDFAPDQRPQASFTVTVLVEDVSKADAPSAIVGTSCFEIPASARVASLRGGQPDNGVPFEVAVPTGMLAAPRRLNVRVHVRPGLSVGDPNVEKVRHEPDSRELGAHPEARELSRATSVLDPTGRPDITKGDFVSTQSHPVLPDPGLLGAVSVRIPVQRV
ncbi:hypothetical protein [Cryobacterium ruanii]|uniref:Uncharacterized protein n=1 Tax=Cryobacterium ruanii TaxID=1259197 RepID=A0A4R9ALU0_9MICO|nr:hypothetical protein [Cryobacterium ruanii]TFD65337.1 hypothetical protein E3T47_10950 [Cryobacterium ruanii]